MTVTVYQPQRAIHRPIVLERSATNFAGLRILVRCLSHDEFLRPSAASKHCGKIAEDLRLQGAESEFVVPVGGNFVQPTVFDGQRPDLTIEIQSKIDHAYSSPMTLMASILTFTVVPSVSEYTFSQRVVVLGRDRSVLTEETFRERFVEYHGVGIWSVNWMLNWFFRSDDEVVSDDATKQDFSRDFFGQVRQLAFNARIRSEILGLTEGPANTRKVTTAPKNPSLMNDETPSLLDDSGKPGREGEANPRGGDPADLGDGATTPPEDALTLPGLSDDAASDPAEDEN